jgi:hypothetical protein
MYWKQLETGEEKLMMFDGMKKAWPVVGVHMHQV